MRRKRRRRERKPKWLTNPVSYDSFDVTVSEKTVFSGLVTPAEGLVTPSGITSIPAGMETPEAIELRKKRIESEMER